MGGAVAQRPSEPQPVVYDSALFGALEWRNIGPNRGGRSQAVAGSSNRRLEYWFGATGGGLWKTTDGGTTWQPVSDQHFRTSSVGAIGVCEANPDLVYVGMGETELRGNIIQGDGVYRTTDGGRSWIHVGLGTTQAIARVRVHPWNCDRVYVAALGHPYGPNEERGIFRSDDGGRTWQRILYRDARIGAIDLALDPQRPEVMYAAFWDVYRTPWGLSSGGPGSGLFRSTDGGRTWTEITKNPGMPEGPLGKIGISASGADSKRVYAIIEAKEGGVFRSDDGGATWERVNKERRLRQRAFYYTRVYADPKDPEAVYVLNTGLYRSTDGGKTFRPIRVPHGDNHDLWIDPGDPRRLINSNDGGANVSYNGGETWTEQDYPTAQFYHVITTRHSPYHVCGAQQDNSTACVPSKDWRHLASPRADFREFLYAVGGGESGYVAADPENPNVFYAGSYGGLLTRYDHATGELRNVQVWPENPMGHSSKDIKERFQWTFPIVVSPLDPNVLYVGSQHLWRSTNEGQSWERISPDLTRADPRTMGPSGGPITLDQTGVETYAVIFTIAPSRREPNTIWVGSDDGLIHLTRDGAKNWQNVTPKELPEFSRVSLIEASPHRAGSAYVAANRYQLDDRTPHLFRTDDYGGTWTKIVGGIPQDDFVRAVREDPKREGLLYAGTEHGIFVSFDNGGRWQPLRLNLPVVPVPDLIVEENDLVIATHGRSFWILDHIQPLRELSPEVARAAAHLFQPAGPVRSVDPGVTVQYSLKGPAQEVTLEFLDASGNVIRRFEGSVADTVRPREEGPPGEDQEPREPRVPAKAGAQRFIWNLRYPGPAAFEGMIFWAAGREGPQAPPGSYQVRLTANGVTQTHSFEVKIDPRLNDVTAADLRAQFELALQIRDKVSGTNEAVMRIRELKRQIEDRLGKAQSASLRSMAESFRDRLGEIEGEIYQVRLESSQDPLNFPIKLNNKIAYLLRVVESAEARPTDSAYEAFRFLSGQLDEQLARLDGDVATALPELNRRLSSEGIQPIRAEKGSP
ncbi:MAG: glycosyl hydrolase [Gemmatimonadetes bacterium]|nr:glycosyl hydrolase [Gemmatimonadota bacterium]